MVSKILKQMTDDERRIFCKVCKRLTKRGVKNIDKILEDDFDLYQEEFMELIANIKDIDNPSPEERIALTIEEILEGVISECDEDDEETEEERFEREVQESVEDQEEDALIELIVDSVCKEDDDD